MQDIGINARMWTDVKRQPLYETRGLGQNTARRTLEYTKPLRSFYTASANSGHQINIQPTHKCSYFFGAFFMSMAVTIAFGLGFATVLTMIVVPVL